MDREKKKAIVVISVLVALMGAGVWFYQGTEPPATVTAARLEALADGVRAYHEAEGRVPVSWEELVLSEHFSGEKDYAWGDEFRYRVVSDTEVELMNLGADKKEGGMMFKKDRVVNVVVGPGGE